MDISEPIIACIADLAFKYAGKISRLAPKPNFFYARIAGIAVSIFVILHCFTMNFVQHVSS